MLRLPNYSRALIFVSSIFLSEYFILHSTFYQFFLFCVLIHCCVREPCVDLTIMYILNCTRIKKEHCPKSVSLFNVPRRY